MVLFYNVFKFYIFYNNWLNQEDSIIYFEIYGTPKPLKRHRHFGRRVYDPSKKDKETFLLKSYKHKPSKQIIGPLKVALAFYFKRPKSHYRSGKYSYLLKKNAPIKHTTTPDLSNLVKFVEDALQGKDGFYKDDSQIIEIKCEKHYAEINEQARTEVMIDVCQ